MRDMEAWKAYHIILMQGQDNFLHEKPRIDKIEAFIAADIIYLQAARFCAIDRCNWTGLKNFENRTQHWQLQGLCIAIMWNGNIWLDMACLTPSGRRNILLHGLQAPAMTYCWIPNDCVKAW